MFRLVSGYYGFTPLIVNFCQNVAGTCPSIVQGRDDYKLSQLFPG